MGDNLPERERAVNLVLSQIDKQFGKGSVMRLGSRETITDGMVIPTGSLSFDTALGIGGMPPLDHTVIDDRKETASLLRKHGG